MITQAQRADGARPRSGKAGMRPRVSRFLPRLLRRPDPLAAAVAAALNQGVGLYRTHWPLPAAALDPATLHTMAEQVIVWCAEEMGRTRRPYGIDHMAVGVACAPAGGSPIASATFGIFRALDFHRAGGAAEDIAGFVRALPLDRIRREPRPVRLAAALFSWGDLARVTIYRDAPAR